MQQEQHHITASPLFATQKTEDRCAPVAVLDSGVGGLSVLREIHRILPCEELLYFGDSQNAPYGEKPPTLVREWILQHAARLLKQAKALVLACNTATALAAEELRALYPQKPIIGMEPALKPAVCIGHAPRVLLLATATTLREEKFAALLKKYEKSATVTALSAPLLVEYAERGACRDPALRSYLSTLLAKQKETPPDALVLGCTHFFYAKELILETLGVDIPVFDGIRATAAQLARRLDQQDLRNPTPQRGSVTFTSSKERILPLYAKLFFGE